MPKTSQSHSCKLDGCVRRAEQELDGYCLGHFHILVYGPARKRYNDARDKWLRVLAHTPKSLLTATIKSMGIDETF